MQVLTTAPPRHALPTGAIVPLVSLLDGKEGPEAQEAAAGALLCLADHEGARLAITEADGIGWLVMLLGCENPRARQHAEGALVRLSISVSNRVLIIKKLVDMLQDAGTSAQEQAAAALTDLHALGFAHGAQRLFAIPLRSGAAGPMVQAPRPPGWRPGDDDDGPTRGIAHARTLGARALARAVPRAVGRARRQLAAGTTPSKLTRTLGWADATAVRAAARGASAHGLLALWTGPAVSTEAHCWRGSKAVAAGGVAHGARW
jgi:hypothetical protein